ncbi:escrt-2 complex [Babesia gibsoni]|uniref:Escrt-2 complex n=1 Tax=Babesia gibsoni TaxID=33632 RepID=A0AAD8LQR6_BABGI|nr:escrt-2 complex [Babesia gibsoni]
MRRGIGASRIVSSQSERERWETLANSLEKESLETFQCLAEDFKKSLSIFIDKYKELINEDKEFRLEFLEMCDLIGLDPLVHSSHSWSNKLGLSHLYSEISVRMLDLCIRNRSTSGGLCDIEQLIDAFPQKLRVSEKDILKCIEWCKPFGGNSIKVIDVSGKRLLLTTPVVMVNEHHQLLKMAYERKFGISITHIKEYLGWSSQKALSTLNYFIQRQIVWIDESNGETYYWFPCLLGTYRSQLDNASDALFT